MARVVQIGHSLYVTIPAPIRNQAGLKPGDRVAVETDGRSVIFAKIPFEELINRALLKRSVAGANDEQGGPGGK